jgi:hypothetical protein
VCQKRHELTIVIQRRRSNEIEAQFASDALCLHVDVEEHLEVITYEPNGTRDDVTYSFGPLGSKNLENVGSDPRVGCPAGRLPRNIPAIDVGN